MIEQWLIFYRRYKFLPLTFGIGLLALVLRVQIASRDAKHGLFITTAYVEAEDKASAPAAATDAKKPDAAAPAASADKTVDKSAAPADGKAADAAAADPLNPDNQAMRPSEELSILKDLADRRAQIEKREAELDERAALLDAGEKQFDQKIKQLTDLRNEIKGLLEAAKTQQGDETKRLIDIYEKMKPKDAAGIFANMNMEVLYPIVLGMKEAKLSPILAAMPPDKARLVTATLTERAKILQEDAPAMAAASAATAAPPPAAQSNIKAPPAAPATPPAPAK